MIQLSNFANIYITVIMIIIMIILTCILYCSTFIVIKCLSKISGNS